MEKRTIFLIGDGEHIVLRRRPEKGLLAGLYEFPNEPGYLTEQETRERLLAYGLRIAGMKKLPPAKHVFSHVTWQMEGYQIEVLPGDLEDAGFQLNEDLPADSDSGATMEISAQNSGDSENTDGWIAVSREDLEHTYTIPAAFDTYRKLV